MLFTPSLLSAALLVAALQCHVSKPLAAAPANATDTSGSPTAPSRPPAVVADEVDWEKARALYQRSQRGEKLTAEEDAYFKRAMAARNARPAGARSGKQRPPPEHLTPLTDMGAEDRYEGEDGGLYGSGRNTPPDSHR